MIVLADADLERAANCATYYSMFNCGQTCISVERIYVEDAVYDEFVDRVITKVRALRQGPSTGPGTSEIGAMTAPAQLALVASHVQDALARGPVRLSAARRARISPATGSHPRCCLTLITRWRACGKRPSARSWRSCGCATRRQRFTWPTTAPTGWRRPRLVATASGPRPSPGESRRALCVSTTPWSTTHCSSCRWAAGSRAASARVRPRRDPQILPSAVAHGVMDPLRRKEPFMYPYRAGTTRLLQRTLRVAFGRSRWTGHARPRVP